MLHLRVWQCIPSYPCIQAHWPGLIHVPLFAQDGEHIAEIVMTNASDKGNEITQVNKDYSKKPNCRPRRSARFEHAKCAANFFKMREMRQKYLRNAQFCAFHCFQPVFHIMWCLNHRKIDITRLFLKISLHFERAVTEIPSPFYFQLTERPPFHSMILFHDSPKYLLFVKKEAHNPKFVLLLKMRHQTSNARFVCAFAQSRKTPSPT